MVAMMLSARQAKNGSIAEGVSGLAAFGGYAAHVFVPFEP